MNNSKDSLGDRIKMLERIASHELIPGLPVIIRLDGKAFHTFTRGLERPYDVRFQNLMIATTKFLVELTNARIGYTQSDEITLILWSGNEKSQIFFNGRRDKLISILASYATMFFNRHLSEHLPNKCDMSDENAPMFDARVFCVPNLTEATNVLIWREQDATRNSISMAAQARFSHKQLNGVSCDQMQEMLFSECNINWNDYPAAFKRGTYIRRSTVSKPFTVTEINSLPPLHDARKNPALIIERQITEIIDMPILTTVANKVSTIFFGDRPITWSND